MHIRNDREFKKKLEKLAAAALAAMSLASCTKSETQENEWQIPITEPRHFDEGNIENYKEELRQRIENGILELDQNDQEYLYGVYLNGDSVTIELVDRENRVVGEPEAISLKNIVLPNLWVCDEECLEDYKKLIYYEKYKTYDEFEDAWTNHKRIPISFQNVTVTNDFRWDSTYGLYYDYGQNWACLELSDIDFSQISSAMFYCFPLGFDDENILANCQNLKELYLFDIISGRLNLKNDSVEKLYIEGQNLGDIDLNDCPNLQILRTNNDNKINLNGIRNCKKLRMLLYQLAWSSSIERISDNPDEIWARELEQPSPTDPFQSTAKANFISDFSAIENSNIEVLDISEFNSISDKQLLDLLKKLPHLKRILAYEVNNADLCSDEVFDFLEQNGVEHPFTEKSLNIKHQLQGIIGNIITDEMSDFEKTEAITKFVINLMDYDKDTLNEEESPEQIRKLWGENLEYALEGHGICAGYAKLVNALLHEAGLESYFQTGPDHLFNLVNVDGKNYWLDCTLLDTDLKIDPWTYNFIPDTKYYLTRDLNDWMDADYYKLLYTDDQNLARYKYTDDIKRNFIIPDIAEAQAKRGIYEVLDGLGAIKPGEDEVKYIVTKHGKVLGTGNLDKVYDIFATTDPDGVKVEERKEFETGVFAICAANISERDLSVVEYQVANQSNLTNVSSMQVGE